VQAKLRAERRRQEAAAQFSQFAIKGEHYEDLLAPAEPSRPRPKQIYRSRLKFLRRRDKPKSPQQKFTRSRNKPPERNRWVRPGGE